MRSSSGLDRSCGKADIMRDLRLVAKMSYCLAGAGRPVPMDVEFAMPKTGHCLCRAVQFEFEGDPVATFHCQCETCRRATSSPMTTWLTVAKAGFRFIKGAPAYYGSSPGVRRGFCTTCGSPLSYENDKMPKEIDLYAAALNDPTAVAPTRHVFAREQLPWFEVHDTLPRYATTMRGGDPPVRHGPK